MQRSLPAVAACPLAARGRPHLGTNVPAPPSLVRCPSAWLKRLPDKVVQSAQSCKAVGAESGEGCGPALTSSTEPPLPRLERYRTWQSAAQGRGPPIQTSTAAPRMATTFPPSTPPTVAEVVYREAERLFTEAGSLCLPCRLPGSGTPPLQQQTPPPASDAPWRRRPLRAAPGRGPQRCTRSAGAGC